MIHRLLVPLILIFIAGRGLTSPRAFGQNENRLQLSKPKSAAEALKQGRLLIVVFRDGQPARGIKVEGQFGAADTRSDGTLNAAVPAGRQQIRVAGLEKPLELSVVPDEETQVTIHLSSNDSSRASVATPAQLVSEQSKAALTKAPVRFEVTDSKRQPLSGATILLSGEEHPLQTDENGFARADVAGGRLSITVFHPKYQTRTLSELDIGQSAAPVRVTLNEASNELEEVLVLAPKIKGSVSALVEVRRSSSAVTDVLGAEQMARQGDGDAAASLRRVTGLTLMNGKYVYVRGLGERYSGVQMNQFGLPSPEPARRVVPLDLFPTAILESVVVQKSYSPDLPGEFGGGMIQLQTRTLPEKRFFKVSLSAAAENADNRLTYRGGATDWLGVDDGTRKMPKAISDALGAGRKLIVKQPGSEEGLAEDELTRLGRALSNNYSVRKTSKRSIPGLTVSTGDRFSIAGAQVGMAGSLLYGQSVDSRTRLSRGLNAAGGGRYAIDYERKSELSEAETRLAGNLDLGIEISRRHRLNLTTFLLRHTTDYTQTELSADPNSPSIIDSSTLDWTERMLWTKHIKGEHEIGTSFGNPIRAAWRAGWSDAGRESPDRRELSYERTPNSYQMRSDSGGNRRTYSELDDRSREFGADITIPLARQANKLSLKTGLAHLTRERRSDVFRLFFVCPPSGGSPEEILRAENIGPGKCQLQNLTDAADSYSGAQSVFAQYASLEYSPVKDWSIQAGARHETSVQKVVTFPYFDPGKPLSSSRLDMNDVLPAYALVWKPDDHWRARLAYSETLARPDFRELSEVGFIDDESGYEVRGNSRLKGTVIRNLDHRWEYYFTTDEYASIGGFYKKFQDPIEVMFIPGVNRIQSFDNAKAATNYGAELESRVGLRHFSRTLRRWSVLSNLTLIQSKIELDERNRGIQTSDERPLQGQSPYVVNFQLQYDRPLWGLSTTVLYNIIGKRITEVGTNQVPDTFEEPFHQVDFVASKSLDKTWSVSLRAKNLLDPLVKSRQGPIVVREQRYGRLFGMSLSGVF